MEHAGQGRDSGATESTGVASKVDPRDSECQGPEIRVLTQHLAECPEIFLEEPIQPSGQGSVNVAAVVSDLLVKQGGKKLTATEAKAFRYPSKKGVRKHRNRLRVTLLASWLYSCPELQGWSPHVQLRSWLKKGLNELANLVSADELVGDAERREEFARICLDAISLHPKGETHSEAQNRLAALSTVERARVVKAARAAEARARKVREEMLAKERARQAASTYSRE